MTIKFQYITDTEGDLDFFKKQIKNSNIVRFTNDDENEIKFISPELDTRLVFGGDICDRGHDITITNMLVNFKEKHPDRVVLILGNRDANKTRFATELPLSPDAALNDTIDAVVKTPFGRSFRDYLAAKFPDNITESLNTSVNRLKWILEDTMGAPQAFESRRKELADINNKSVGDEDVFTSFRASVEPNGFMRKYISLAQIGVIIGDTIIVHGAITPTNVGKVPNGFIAFEETPLASTSSFFQPPAMLDADDVHAWIEQLNYWYQSAVKRWVDTPFQAPSYQYRDDVPSSPIQHIASGVGSKFASKTPVVSTFLKERRTPWMVAESVARYLEQGSVKRILAGHQPHGDTPLFIIGYEGEEISKNSIQVFTCDTLYGNQHAYHPTDGARIRNTDPRGTSYATVHVTYDEKSKESATYIQGVSGFGIPYETTIHFPAKNEGDRFLGRILKIDGEEHIVRLNSPNEDQNYILTYVKGQFAVTPKTVSREYLEEQEQLGLNVFASIVQDSEFNTSEASCSYSC